MRRILVTVTTLGLVAVCTQPAAAQGEKPSDCPQSIVVNFPTAGPFETQWDLCYEAISKYGLVIRHGSFRPSPLAPHVKVLADARVAEIFVPYYSGKPRFYDIKGANYKVRTLNTKDCPASVGGTLLAEGKVCRELRDSGLAWRHGDQARRGEEVVLWSILKAGNYEYIIEWAFQDDGTFKGQVGSTGPTRRKTPTLGHMHNFTWRVDIDLDGAEGDSVHWTSHSESLEGEGFGSTATDEEELVATEATREWDPAEFPTAKITDSALQNPNGRQTAYELIPVRSGSARHKEVFTKTDFWVTRHKPTELLAAHLVSYLNNESVDGQDVVLWYTGSACHLDNMRDEDTNTVPVKWVGFTLKPKNLFARTPLYP
jgi:primary-amine oxidase